MKTKKDHTPASVQELFEASAKMHEACTKKLNKLELKKMKGSDMTAEELLDMGYCSGMQTAFCLSLQSLTLILNQK
jgi:hypothetical protein